MPSLSISFKFNKKKNLNFSKTVFEDKDSFNLFYEKRSFNFMYKDDDSRIILIFGLIIKDEEIINDRVINELNSINYSNLDLLKETIRDLNGQFLIVIFDKNINELFVINDRFNSIPIYYAKINNKIFLSHLYFDLFSKLRKLDSFSINQDSIMEFLWFNRLFGDKTYDSQSKFLLPASILKIKDSDIVNYRYWKPNFNKTKQRLPQAGKKFIYLIKKSVLRLTSDMKNYGIFLSGGHDSRLVLSGFKAKPKSFTVGFSDNYEVKCAREVASHVKSDHTFIRLESNHFSKNLDYITKITGAQYAFTNALFVGLDKKEFMNIDANFHGHGIDYLFQGMYLPAKYYKIFGSPTFLKYFSFDYNNIVDQFINRIPYRVKGTDIKKYIIKNKLNTVLSNLHKNIKSIFDEADKINSIKDNYDKWEFIQIHTLGRHYSRANILSKMCYAPQRCVMFDNDIFDFYLSLDKKYRLNSDVVRYALRNMGNKIGNIPTGNWGFPASDNPLLKTLKLIWRKVKRNLTGNQIFKAPVAEDRTWPDNDKLIRLDINLRTEIQKMFENKELINNLDKLDWSKLKKSADEWLDKNTGGAQFLIALLTISKFLELTR
tara:strand:- start:5324 stop:7129 length:1806 start_codon:yes stop_codon:yes gene_type:complete